MASDTDGDRGIAFAKESLEKWTPRFVANGVDHNDLERLEAEIDGWAEWCDAFAETGAAHAELGEAALDRDDTESAGAHFVQASLYYHFGSHVWHVDDERRDEAHQRSVRLFRRAGDHLNPPAKRIEAPHEDYQVPGNLRVPDRGPDGSNESPLVVLLPGLDSTKEELHTLTPELLDRGLATLTVDGAAQGETWYEQGMTPSYHESISSMVDYVTEVNPDGVDVSRLGVYGVSLGGFYAPHVAANDERFDACVGISGPFTVGPTSTRGSDLVKEQFEWACKADSLVEVDEITEAMTLRDDIDDLTAPVLTITGANDGIIPPAQTERIAERAPDGTFICYDEGNHVCNNIPYKYRPRAADWLRDQLG